MGFPVISKKDGTQRPGECRRIPSAGDYKGDHKGASPASIRIPTYLPVPGGITESGALLLQVNIKQQPTKVNTN